MTFQRFQKGWDHPQPLTYPFTALPEGGEHSQLVSPRIGKAHDLARPLFPEDDGFQDLLEEVIEVRFMVMAGVWPSDFLAKYHPRADFDPERIPEPLRYHLTDKPDPRACAASVVGDRPLTIPLAVLDWLLALEVEYKRHDPTGHNDFLRREVHTTENLSDASKRIMEKIFEAKYFFGLPRVEEVLGIDGKIITPSIFGCPCHPSYPAGHAGAASASSELDKEFHLEQRQRYEIFDSVFHQSMYRSFGAFHYGPDNIAGMKLGGMFGEKWIA